MLSSLKLTSFSVVGRDEQKKLTTILSNLIDNPDAADFLTPVDWQNLQLNDYLQVIKNPMNLLKVQQKLKNREYKSVEECLDHIQLIWDNCKEYNQEGFYYNLADKLDRSFKKMIKNYLPNIQIIVPAKSMLGINPNMQQQSSQLPSNPLPSSSHSRQQSHNSHKHIGSRNVPQVSSSANISNQQASHYEEPSGNDPNEGGFQPQIEEIPQNEKNRFHQRLKQLTQQELAQIVMIIQENCSEGFKQLGSGRCQILLDSLDVQTFKKMNERIDQLLQVDKNINGTKKVKI